MTHQTQEIQIELCSPLLLGTSREYAIFAETQNYIPGGVLRGSLARLMQETAPAEAFTMLFGTPSAGVIFENLYASPSAASYTHPLPLSARTCKYHGGFLGQRHKDHGVGDILIRQAGFEEVLLDPGAKLPFFYQPRCPDPTCQEEVTRPTVEFYETIGARYFPVTVPIRRLSRTAINRSRHTAADQLLYTLETIEPGELKYGDRKRLVFRGAVHCQPHQVELLQQWLPRLEWLGRGRSRGLGQVTLKLVDPTPIRWPLPERLKAFHEKVLQEWSFFEYVAGVDLVPAETLFFSLDLLAPAIFTHYGLPATQPDLADLGLNPTKAAICRAFTDQE
ncbi:MAG: RAMP superfamily CRISPR-associated protein, partial [Chloroflexota bacterium]